MKIAIIIPLKAKKVANNWHIVEDSLLHTLSSISHQTDSRYCACVVGHDCPSYLGEKAPGFSQIDFVQFDDLPPPELTDDATKNQEMFEKDRCSKIYKGYEHLLKKHPQTTHVFPLDADDLLHEDFVKLLAEYNESSYIIENGYFYYSASNVINRTSSFSSFCGSSAILSRQLIDSEIENNNRFIFKHIGHVHMKDYLRSQHISFHVPKKKLVMYVRDNGENISRLVKGSLLFKLKRNIKKWMRAIPLPSSLILKRFGVKK